MCCDEKGGDCLPPPSPPPGMSPRHSSYAFDLLELDSRPTCGESRLRYARFRWRASLNEHLEHPEGHVVFRHACKMGLEEAGIAVTEIECSCAPGKKALTKDCNAGRRCGRLTVNGRDVGE